MSRKRRKQTAEQAKPAAAPAVAPAPHPIAIIKTPLRLPVWKKTLFALATVAAFFGVLEFALWAAGVTPVAVTDDPYVGFTSVTPLFTPSSDPAILETSPAKRKFFNEQKFARKKPAGVYRIFCVGGSTTYGHPYDNSTSFCSWLGKLLPLADPSRKWEVINCGGISYASYRDAIIIEEIAQYEPDLVVIYGSQNEFLERRTYDRVIETPPAIRGIGALASRTRVFTAANWVVGRLRGGEATAPKSVLGAEVETRLDQAGVVGPSDYARDETLESQIVEHFRFNMARMIDLASAAGAKTLVVSPASNLRDCSPFKSQFSEAVARDPQQVKQIETLLAQVRGAIAASGNPALKPKEVDWGAALATVDRALALDERYAESHYLRGRVLDRLGQFADAKRAYENARDEDVCPLRATARLLSVVDEIAADRHVPEIDFVQLVADASPGHIADATLFLDHVHPTIDGNLMLAQAIVERLAAEKQLALSTQWNQREIEAVAAQVKAGIDREAHARALRNLAKVLDWAGKFDEARRAAQQATQLADDAEAYFRMGHIATVERRYQDAIDAFEKSLQISPETGITYAALGAVYEAIGNYQAALGCYERAIPLTTGREHIRSQTMAAAVLARLGRLSDAIAELRAIVADAPDYAEAHHQLAMALARNNDMDGSLAQFAEASRLEPKNARILANWGGALLTAARYQEAADTLESALELDAGNARTHVNYAVAMRALDKPEAAETHYREANRLDESLDDAAAGLVETLAEKKDFGKVDEVLAGRLSPKMAQIALQLAWKLSTAPAAEQRSGNWALAWTKRLQQASGEPSAEVLDVLAAAYAECGDYERAVQTANLAIAAAVRMMNDRLANEARERLQTYRSGRPYRALSCR